MLQGFTAISLVFQCSRIFEVDAIQGDVMDDLSQSCHVTVTVTVT